MALSRRRSPPFAFLDHRCGGARRFSFERLEDRLSPAGFDPGISNSIALGGQFGSLQFAPNGELVQLAWEGDDLFYRSRNVSGAWSQEKIFTYPDVGHYLTWETGGQQRVFGWSDVSASLLFDPAGTPHVLLPFDDNYWHDEIVHLRRDASWQQVEVLTPAPVGAPPGWDGNIGIGGTFFRREFTAAVGQDGSLHVAFAQDLFDFDWDRDYSPFQLIYATNKTGDWTWEKIADLTDNSSFEMDYSPRYFSMAVDSQGFAHLAFTPRFDSTPVPGGTTPFSQLVYATNQSGAWTTQVVHQPGDGSGDSGLGSSIAVGPGNQIAIAHFYAERVVTGSSQFSQLLYHTRQGNGTWATEVVATAPDNYAAGDGARYTGFAPQLVFDGAGQPNIVFSDHASQHFPITGADEFAGQVRHAVRTPGGWAFRTVFRQSNPIINTFIFPTMALSSTELAFTGLRRQDIVAADSDMKILDSDYYYELITSFPFGPPGWKPIAGDWDGSGADTIGVFDPNSATWYLRNRNSAGGVSLAPFQFGAAGWIPLVGDWNGDGIDTIGLFDPTTARWYLRNSNSSGGVDVPVFQFGAAGWLPVVGDWNGDGVDTVGLFDPTTARWYLRNANSAGVVDFPVFQYGAAGWIPVVGDWNGYGDTTIGVFDPASSTWYLRNSNSAGPVSYAPFSDGPAGPIPVVGDWDANGSSDMGVFQVSNGLWTLRHSVTPNGARAAIFRYGPPSWTPVVGDWNNDRSETIGVFDPAAANWYLRNANSAGGPSVTPFQYGAGVWKPIVGDFNGDRIDTIGMFDPASATWYLRNSNSSGNPSITPFQYGVAGWKPLVGDWNGDGIDTVGVFNPITASWYLRDANSAGGITVPEFQFGGRDWVPLVGDWNGDGIDTIGVYDPGSFTWYLRNSNAAGGPDIAPFPFGCAGWIPLVGDFNGDNVTDVGMFDPVLGTWYLRTIAGALGFSGSAAAVTTRPIGLTQLHVDAAVLVEPNPDKSNSAGFTSVAASVSVEPAIEPQHPVDDRAPALPDQSRRRFVGGLIPEAVDEVFSELR